MPIAVLPIVDHTESERNNVLPQSYLPELERVEQVHLVATETGMAKMIACTCHTVVALVSDLDTRGSGCRKSPGAGRSSRQADAGRRRSAAPCTTPVINTTTG